MYVGVQSSYSQSKHDMLRLLPHCPSWMPRRGREPAVSAKQTSIRRRVSCSSPSASLCKTLAGHRAPQGLHAMTSTSNPVQGLWTAKGARLVISNQHFRCGRSG